MTDEDRPEVGSVAEETAKLLGALGEVFHDASAHIGHSDDCKYCPLCRVVNVVRGASPEVRTHLALAAANIAQAASAVLAQAVPDEQRADRKEPVEKIDLDADDSDPGDFGPFEGPFG